VVESNAGDPAHSSYWVLERAKASPDRWRVSEVPGPCPWLDPDDLAEQRAELTDWEYRRLHLNEWVESEDRLTNVGDFRACVTLDGPREWARGRRYALSLDLGLKHDRTVLAVCSAETGAPAVALDRMLAWQGSRCEPVSLDEVEAAALEAWAARRGPVAGGAADPTASPPRRAHHRVLVLEPVDQPARAPPARVDPRPGTRAAGRPGAARRAR
jgi:hypothetical protein